jgi:hypothetical protein
MKALLLTLTIAALGVSAGTAHATVVGGGSDPMYPGTSASRAFAKELASGPSCKFQVGGRVTDGRQVAAAQTPDAPKKFIPAGSAKFVQ